MPQQPGEVTLCTLFADVHYYFSHPAAKPQHHRFDKRSYVYLYHDAMNRRGRLEIANYAGTPDQDAFMGYLNSTIIDYSYKHPTLFTITVDASRPPSSPPPDVSQWHLPTADPHNQGKYMYKLHTVDLYFWTAEDGSLFLDSLRRVVAENQIRIADAPPSEHRNSMSPVVQQLERIAVSTPSAHPPTNSIANAQSQPARFNSVSPPGHVSNQSPAQYAPVSAYNPAAPPAPEPIAHREKTPPPPDADSGTGLKAASQYDAAVPQFAGPPQPAYVQQPYFSGPPGQPQQGLQQGPYAASAPQPQQSPYAQNFAAPPTQPQDPNAQFILQQSQSQRHPSMPASFGPYAASTISSAIPGQQSPTPPAVAPPAYQAQPSPGYPSHASPGYPPQQQMQDPNAQFMPQQPQQANYVYGTHPTSEIKHDIHSQLYIPEAGAGHGHGHAPPQAGPGQDGATGKLEQAASKYEKKINKFFKRLDSGF